MTGKKSLLLLATAAVVAILVNASANFPLSSLQVLAGTIIIYLVLLLVFRR